MKWLAAAAIAISFHAHAEFYTGNELLAKLDADSVVERAIGLGYVIGVSDMGDGIVHCPPNHVTAGQVRDMVRGYLVRNPAERHLSADVLVNKILKATWPCKPSGRGI